MANATAVQRLMLGVMFRFFLVFSFLFIFLSCCVATYRILFPGLSINRFVRVSSTLA